MNKGKHTAGNVAQLVHSWGCYSVVAGKNEACFDPQCFYKTRCGGERKQWIGNANIKLHWDFKTSSCYVKWIMPINRKMNEWIKVNKQIGDRLVKKQ